MKVGASNADQNLNTSDQSRISECKNCAIILPASRCDSELSDTENWAKQLTGSCSRLGESQVGLRHAAGHTQERRGPGEKKRVPKRNTTPCEEQSP